MTTVLGCDGDSVAMTAATSPSWKFEVEPEWRKHGPTPIPESRKRW